MTPPVERGRLAGLILAGGQSVRMGQDKAQLVWRGRSLLDHARALLLATGVAAIHVGGRPQEADGLPDSQPHAGPARAILDAARLLRGRFDSLLVIPVDMPLLGPDQLAPLLAGPSGQARHWADQPLPALVPIEPCLALDHEDIHSIKRLLASLDARALPRDGATSPFSNINTPDALARLDADG
ncbi:molybdenum cofactor guanylyltransferase [Maricaulis sp.]|uniref:molybdenum cofactor guanylyltransferase n=1 Tax=Maricaulis sp. TaxID=1486257 RepID=UPI003A92E6AD